MWSAPTAGGAASPFEIFARLAKGDSLADIARSYNVDPTTIGRLRPANGDGNGGNGVVHL
jgi:hypothetical protein